MLNHPREVLMVNTNKALNAEIPPYVGVTMQILNTNPILKNP
jgi:hypothetical protein